MKGILLSILRAFLPPRPVSILACDRCDGEERFVSPGRDALTEARLREVADARGCRFLGRSTFLCPLCAEKARGRHNTIARPGGFDIARPA